MVMYYFMFHLIYLFLAVAFLLGLEEIYRNKTLNVSILGAVAMYNMATSTDYIITLLFLNIITMSLFTYGLNKD